MTITSKAWDLEIAIANREMRSVVSDFECWWLVVGREDSVVPEKREAICGGYLSTVIHVSTHLSEATGRVTSTKVGIEAGAIALEFMEVNIKCM